MSASISERLARQAVAGTAATYEAQLSGLIAWAVRAALDEAAKIAREPIVVDPTDTEVHVNERIAQRIEAMR